MPKADLTLRPAFFAGSWYPAEAAACRRAVGELTQGAALEGSWRGLIAPHAGWPYSGRAAAHGFAALARGAAAVDLVVVFGSHRSAAGPNTVFLGGAWETPLGALPTARALAAAVADACDLDEEPAQPRRPDNGIELQLPFARALFPRAELLAVGVAAAPVAVEIGHEVGRLVREAGREVVFVGSTDLTHYGPSYDFESHGEGDAAVRWVRDENDRRFLDRLLAADAPGCLADAALHDSACCPGAVAATLAALDAFGHAAAPQLVEHYLSYDVQPHHSFVGYASVLL
jgi:AmmeMemoRadiSam system protein B